MFASESSLNEFAANILTHMHSYRLEFHHKWSGNDNNWLTFPHKWLIMNYYKIYRRYLIQKICNSHSVIEVQAKNYEII